MLYVVLICVVYVCYVYVLLLDCLVWVNSDKLVIDFECVLLDVVIECLFVV